MIYALPIHFALGLQIEADEGLATANEEEQAKYYGDAQKIAWEA